MKKVFMTLAVVFMAMAANAQVWMGGSFGLTSEKETNASTPVINYSIAPEVGFPIAEKFDLAVGLRYAGYSWIHKQDNLKYGATSSSIAVQPFLRYKAINCGKVGFFIDGGFEYGYGVVTTALGNHVEKDNTNHFMVGLKPGISFAASDNIVFAARIGSFGYYQEKGGYSKFGIGVDNSAFTLGFWWIF